MTGTESELRRLRYVNGGPCPFCLAPRGQPCWSQFLGRPMINQVHVERKRDSR